MAIDGWRVELLGGLRATRGSERVTKFRTQKSTLLLALLAVQPGREWGREELCEVLWPEIDLPVQRARLRDELRNVRDALGPEIVAKGKHASVAADSARLTSDVAEFDLSFLRAVRSTAPFERVEPLRAAVALYKGDLLPGFYDDWSCGERERLREGLFDALTRLLLDLEGLGLTDEARRVRRDAVSRFPERALPEALPVAEGNGAKEIVPGLVDRYFGREREKEAIQNWAESDAERLLTLVGPGGIGKTRLARESTRERRGLFVPLAEVFDGSRLAEAVHGALGLPTHHGDPYGPSVAFLRGRARPLLILDNLEQIAQGADDFIARLLRDVPALKVLATSRIRLSLDGERALALDPLPDAQATALFLDRARAARPDFAQTVETLTLVGEIVKLLEGLPLAVELAAARSVVLGPRQMLSQLQSRLGFLVNRRAAPVERHRSLRVALDWSLELLPDELKRFFARLSVFRGGFTLEAAEAVAGNVVRSTLDALDDLHAHSLLRATFGEDGEARYDFLVVIREYAEEVLASDAEARAEADEAQASYFDGFTDRCCALPTRAELVRALFPDLDNVRRALDRCVAARDVQTIYRYLDRLGGVFFEAGHWHDMKRLMDALEDANLEPKERMRYVSLQGALARRQGREEDAEKWWFEWYEISNFTNDLESVRAALANLSMQSIDLKDIEKAVLFADKLNKISEEKIDKSSLLIIESRIYLLKNEDSLAYENARQAVDLLISICDFDHLSSPLLVYGLLVIVKTGKFEDIIILLVEGMKKAIEKESLYFLSYIGMIFGIIFREIGDKNLEKASFGFSLDICRAISARIEPEVAQLWWEAAGTLRVPAQSERLAHGWGVAGANLIEKILPELCRRYPHLGLSKNATNG